MTRRGVPGQPSAAASESLEGLPVLSESVPSKSILSESVLSESVLSESVLSERSPSLRQRWPLARRCHRARASRIRSGE